MVSCCEPVQTMSARPRPEDQPGQLACEAAPLRPVAMPAPSWRHQGSRQGAAPQPGRVPLPPLHPLGEPPRGGATHRSSQRQREPEAASPRATQPGGRRGRSASRGRGRSRSRSRGRSGHGREWHHRSRYDRRSCSRRRRSRSWDDAGSQRRHHGEARSRSRPRRRSRSRSPGSHGTHRRDSDRHSLESGSRHEREQQRARGGDGPEAKRGAGGPPGGATQAAPPDTAFHRWAAPLFVLWRGCLGGSVAHRRLWGCLHIVRGALVMLCTPHC